MSYSCHLLNLKVAKSVQLQFFYPKDLDHCSSSNTHEPSLKKPGDFTVLKGHEYPLVYLYNKHGGRAFSFIRFVIRLVVHPSLHPSKAKNGRRRTTAGGSTSAHKVWPE
jgi:hypothetical protein